MWRRTENSEPIMPAAIEHSGCIVIVRRNFARVEATEETPEHYEWDEWQMTQEQYEVYESLTTSMREQEDALVELAELISEVV